MSTFDENQIIKYNQDESCKISDLNIGFIESLKSWIRKKLITNKDRKVIESGLRDNLKYNAANTNKQAREKLIVKDKLESTSNTVTNLYTEITGALAYNYAQDKFKSRDLSIELRDFIIDYLFNSSYKLLKAKARDYYESSKRGYESEAELNITAANITDSIDKDITDSRAHNGGDGSFLLNDLQCINDNSNYTELHTIVYSEDYSTIKLSGEHNTRENRLRFSRGIDDLSEKIKKNIKDTEYDLLIDIEEESEVYIDVKPVRINLDEVRGKLDKIDYKRCTAKERNRLNDERVKYNREVNLKGEKNYLISFNNNRNKLFNKITILETMINKFFNNILISKIILDTQDSTDSYVNLYKQFSVNYYSFGDFNYLHGYEIEQYRKQVDEDIKNNSGIYDKSSLELNNYMPKHIKDIYINNLERSVRFNGELILVDRDKENIEEDIKYMDELIDYYREDKGEERKKRRKGHAPVECSSFQDYLDLTVGKLINARIKSVVDKYNLDDGKSKYHFISYIQRFNYKYVDREYSAPLTDLFLLYFEKDTMDLLNKNCLQKVLKFEDTYKQQVLFNVLEDIYEHDIHIKKFNKTIDSQYIDDNNNIITGLQNKNLVVQLHKELYYRCFNLSYLSKAIEDRVKKIIARYYYIEFMNKKKKDIDRIKDEKNTYYNYKNKLIKREYSVAANKNMLLNIDDLFKDEYIEYLDHCNKFTLHDNFMRAKDAEPWYEESDRFMDIPYSEKLTLFEEYTLIDNEYIIENVAKPVVIKFNELVNKIVSAKNKKSVLSNIQKLVRLALNLEGITNITNSYINQEYDYKTEISEEFDNYKQGTIDFIDDNIIMSRRNNVFREYFDLINFALYNNNVPYNLTHFTDNDRAFKFKNIINKPGDTDCRDHFWLTDYEEIFGKRVIKENHLENLNWPDYNNASSLSEHMLNYIEEVAESRVLYKIKIADINKL